MCRVNMHSTQLHVLYLFYKQAGMDGLLSHESSAKAEPRPLEGANQLLISLYQHCIRLHFISGQTLLSTATYKCGTMEANRMEGQCHRTF